MRKQLISFLLILMPYVYGSNNGNILHTLITKADVNEFTKQCHLYLWSCRGNKELINTSLCNLIEYTNKIQEETKEELQRMENKKRNNRKIVKGIAIAGGSVYALSIPAATVLKIFLNICGIDKNKPEAGFLFHYINTPFKPIGWLFPEKLAPYIGSLSIIALGFVGGFGIKHSQSVIKKGLHYRDFLERKINALDRIVEYLRNKVEQNNSLSQNI